MGGARFSGACSPNWRASHSPLRSSWLLLSGANRGRANRGQASQGLPVQRVFCATHLRGQALSPHAICPHSPLPFWQRMCDRCSCVSRRNRFGTGTFLRMRDGRCVSGAWRSVCDPLMVGTGFVSTPPHPSPFAVWVLPSVQFISALTAFVQHTFWR